MNYYKYTYRNFWIYIITILTFIVFISLPIEIVLAIKNIYLELIVMLLIFVIHEILHGIGFRLFGHAKGKNIVYGAKLESGIFYCACKEEISKAGIIGSLLIPIIFLTILPFIIGFTYSNNILILIGIINLLGATFDILATIDIIRLPRDVRYKDLDDAMGFILISNDELSKFKYFGLKLIEVGNYNPRKIKAIKYNKITITKPSLIIFAVSICLLLISFVL